MNNVIAQSTLATTIHIFGLIGPGRSLKFKYVTPRVRDAWTATPAQLMMTQRMYGVRIHTVIIPAAQRKAIIRKYQKRYGRRSVARVSTATVSANMRAMPSYTENWLSKSAKIRT